MVVGQRTIIAVTYIALVDGHVGIAKDGTALSAAVNVAGEEVGVTLVINP